MTIELQQISPWFQIALKWGWGLRWEGQSRRLLICLCQEKGVITRVEERKRGQLIYSSKKGKRARKGWDGLNLASWGTNSMESRERIRLMGKIMWPMINHWVSNDWDITCGSVQPAIKTSRTSQKKKLDL